MSDISKIQIGSILYDIKDTVARESSVATVTELNDTSDHDHVPSAKAVYDYCQLLKNSNSGTSNESSGVDTLARTFMGSSTLEIMGFNLSTDVEQYENLSPAYNNFYRKASKWIYTNTSTRTKINVKALSFVIYDQGEKIITEPIKPKSYVSTIQYQNYIYNGETLAIELLTSQKVTIDGSEYNFPEGIYLYHNPSENKYISNVTLFTDRLNEHIVNSMENAYSAIRTNQNNISNLTNRIDNMSTTSPSTGETKLINTYFPGDYYAIYTKTSDSSETSPFADAGLQGGIIYKISDYNRVDGIYTLDISYDNEEPISINFNLYDYSTLVGQPLYCGMDMASEIALYVIPETIEGADLAKGLYVEFSSTENDKIFTISHLVKKDLYIPQKIYNEKLGEYLLDEFEKVSNDFILDENGIYTVKSGMVNFQSGEIIVSYNCGGQFAPVGEFIPSLSSLNDYIYCLPSNFICNNFLNSPIVASAVTQDITIPANSINSNHPEIPVTSGLYLFRKSKEEDNPELSLMNAIELIKLQEKDTILDLDELTGRSESNGDLMLEVLLQQLMESGDKAEIDISIVEDNLKTQNLYNTLLSAYNNKGIIKGRVKGHIMSNRMVDIVAPLSLINFPNDDQMLASAIGAIYYESWININIQISSVPDGFIIYAKAAFA